MEIRKAVEKLFYKAADMKAGKLVCKDSVYYMKVTGGGMVRLSDGTYFTPETVAVWIWSPNTLVAPGTVFEVTA